MAGLRLGPLLRYVDADSATVWVETDRPCVVHVHCDDGTAGAEHTWQVAGHHYALVPVTGLAPGSETPYRVLLEDPGAPPSGSREEVWPLPGSRFPASTIRTLPASAQEPLHFAFGSCRWSATPSNAGHDPVGPDALDTLAATLAAGSGRQRPDVLLLLGDQVYADQTSEATAQALAGRRDLTEPPWKQVADYEEYTYLYYESWLDPEVRWLLSTVPSCMIFDDPKVTDLQF